MAGGRAGERDLVLERREWELMRAMEWARIKVYEGAESWYVHKDPEGGRPSQRMVQRKEGSQRCNSYARATW